VTFNFPSPPQFWVTTFLVTLLVCHFSPEDGSIKFLWNTGIHLQYYVMSQSRRPHKIDIVGGGVQLGPLRTAASNGLLCQPQVIMMMEKFVEWLAGETEVFKENLPQCRSVHHKPHILPGREPGCRGGKPLTNRLSYSTASRPQSEQSQLWIPGNLQLSLLRDEGIHHLHCWHCCLKDMSRKINLLCVQTLRFYTIVSHCVIITAAYVTLGDWHSSAVKLEA
jgi:hypothetical protein